MENKFTFIDLFAGIGGFRLALNSIGGNCVNFSEINKDAIETYCINHKESPDSNLGDITKINNLPAHDLLVGGVPCQSWSIAGKKLGFDDDRGQLWNDTLYLLNKSRPKSFIFENVKGLVDPRNKSALNYILGRIKEAGYYANYYVLNSYDFGLPQNRIRIYIVGFLEEEYSLKFKLPKITQNEITLAKILKTNESHDQPNYNKDLFGDVINKRNFSLSNKNGFNDYFLFNDIRNGHSTIHSWDIIETTERQKEICYILLKNRRKSIYGQFDGNPLSLKHFQDIDNTIMHSDLEELIKLNIFKYEKYGYVINDLSNSILSENEKILLEYNIDKKFIIDVLKSNKELILKKFPIENTIQSLVDKGVISCNEVRFDFKNTKISTGLYGVNRVFLPTSNIFPTLVASDTNDYITSTNICASNELEYREKFMDEIYRKKNFRKITKEEACKIQGFPEDFILPENRTRWMKLLGNSVSVPVIEMLGKAILESGVFAEIEKDKVIVG